MDRVIPETDKVSWVMAVISALDSWAFAVTARRRWPTNRVSRANTGTVPMATTVSCHERMDMATRVLRKMTPFARTLETLLVTTVWTPPTSLATRDWISPVRVSVKKLRGWLCRCR